MIDPSVPGWGGPYIFALKPDPWGNHFKYWMTNGAYRIYSAGPDGIAHAHPTARATACHVPAIGERWAWPTLTRCPACLVVGTPLPPGGGGNTDLDPLPQHLPTHA